MVLLYLALLSSERNVVLGLVSGLILGQTAPVAGGQPSKESTSAVCEIYSSNVPSKNVAMKHRQHHVAYN